MTNATFARDALRLLYSWSPLLVGWSATLVVQRATRRPVDPAGLAFLLMGICAAYSLDRVVDGGPDPGRAWVRRTLIATGMVAAFAGALLLVRLPMETAVIVPVLSGIAVGYRSLKRLPLAKNVFVPLVWTWGAIALPFPDGSWFGWRWVAEPVAAPLFLLLATGVLLCDLKDEPIDRSTGVSSVAVVYGGRTTAWIGVALALTTVIAAFAEHRAGLALSAAGLALMALRPRLLATDVIGPLVVDGLLSVPGLLIVWRIV